MKNSTSHTKRACCTFLLGLLHEVLDPISSIYRHADITIFFNDNIEMIDKIKKQLYAHGGMDQMLLFLTRPIGTGKTTAIKAAKHSVLSFVPHETYCDQTHHSFILLTQVQLHHHLEGKL